MIKYVQEWFGNIEIIDCHVHIQRKRPHAVHEIIRIMDQNGISKAVVFPGNDICPDNLGMAKAIEPFRDRLIPFAWLNPLQGEEAVKELEMLVSEYGFKGIKFHPLFHSFYPNRPYVKPIAEKAIELGIPILIHSGHAPYSTPWQIAEFARLYPEATVILDHMGLQVGWVEDAISLAEQYENIILGTTAMPFHERILEAAKKIGSERILYGSDAPSIHPLPELARIKVSGLMGKDLENVLNGTAARILKL